MVVLGTGLLWFGWFGFNAGSAVASNGLAGNAFVTTHVAGATGAMTWMLLAWVFSSKPSIVGAATGAVAGLAAVTPASGFVDTMPALAIGGGASALCYLAVRVRARLRLDDSLDVVGVHGVGGAWGTIAAGIFAVAAVGGADGAIQGNVGQLGTQLLAVGATMGYSLVATLVLLKVLDLTLGLRVSREEEVLGLDIAQHGERAYAYELGAGAVAIPQSAVAPLAPRLEEQVDAIAQLGRQALGKGVPGGRSF
jgi:Amt family ammonium transporter